MSAMQLIPDVLFGEVIAGANADPATPRLLIEVPHGADERGHYDRWRQKLVGDLPEDLHCFFHVNTDVGAWAIGQKLARDLVARQPDLAVRLIRSLIPRTFIDCNRPASTGGGDLSAGGLSAGIPAYVTDDADKSLLMEHHRQYIDVVDAAYAEICGARNGLAVVPHTYGPRTMGIPSIGADIVEQLRWACEPAREVTWPLRAEVDLLTRDGEGVSYAPVGAEEALLQAYRARGLDAQANHTYYLHPSSIGHTWCTRHPQQVLCFEVRRDCIVDRWSPFEEMRAVEDKLGPFVDPLVDVVADALERR